MVLAYILEACIDLSHRKRASLIKLCPLFAVFQSIPTTYHLLIFSFATSSLFLTLHPDSVCMNIDVNYPSAENSCSICEFPQGIWSWGAHTHRKEGIIEVHICCALQPELKSEGVVSVDLIRFIPENPRTPSFPKNTAAQYGMLFLPKEAIA